MAKVSGTLGNGSDTEFDVDTGFGTELALAVLTDLIGGEEVIAYGFQRETPNSTSVRFTLTPAPALDQIQYSVSDGTESP